MYIIFHLSSSGTTYGRTVVEIRICASPGRDSTEKELSTTQKNGKNTEKRSEPSSTSDVISPMPLPSTHSPGSSPTTPYPPRASVLMSTSKDPSTAPEPFQFPTFQTQPKKRKGSQLFVYERVFQNKVFILSYINLYRFFSLDYLVSKDGYVYKRMKKTCAADPTEDELFTITVSLNYSLEMQPLNCKNWSGFKHDFTYFTNNEVASLRTGNVILFCV